MILSETGSQGLDENGAKSKSIALVHGNEDVLHFYDRYGFRPSQISLAQLKT